MKHFFFVHSGFGRSPQVKAFIRRLWSEAEEDGDPPSYRQWIDTFYNNGVYTCRICCYVWVNDIYGASKDEADKEWTRLVDFGYGVVAGEAMEYLFDVAIKLCRDPTIKVC